MSDPIIVAVDPGKMTGFAMFGFPADQINTGQGSWMQIARWIDAFTKAASDQARDVRLVSESFVITQATLKKSRENWSLEFIGLLRYWSESRLSRELTLQSPSQAKSFCDDDRLKKIGWFLPGNVHANDAARHLLLYMVENKMFDLRALV